MIRFLLRFFGLLLLALAFIFVVYDGTKWIASKGAEPTTKVSTVWLNVHQKSFEQAQSAIAQWVGDWLWQVAIQPFFFEQPAWLVLGIVAIVLILLGRKKKPLIGYARD
jgi:hypothetical protein